MTPVALGLTASFCRVSSNCKGGEEFVAPPLTGPGILVDEALIFFGDGMRSELTVLNVVFFLGEKALMPPPI